ncbi:hypothetical protein DMC30DRAFT_170731 [Rhodotorula diobovata]|uniref:Uncharacterized protein n=1 Tax=Rhodotorula diobovata TaxID=5288 RepID=A0A5C5FZK1_9BASI|nr:hypothetical protein DMC30DRAFT_170731 [Rhodotorula diobovata]
MMASSPGDPSSSLAAAPPPRPPPHSTASTHRPPHSDPSSAPATSTSDDDAAGDDPDDDELVLHPEQPATYLQQQRAGAAAGGRRRSSSLAEKPRLNGQLKRSSSDWRDGQASGLVRRGDASTSTSTSTSTDGDEEGRDQLRGLGGLAAHHRSRTSSFSGSANPRRRPPPSSLSTARAPVNGHDHLHAHFGPEATPSSRSSPATTAPYALSRPGSASRLSSASTQRRSSGTRPGRGLPVGEEMRREATGPVGSADARDVKGKGRAHEPPPEPAAHDAPPPPPSNDPLDPLFALSHSPSYSSFAPFGSSPSYASSLQSAGRLGAGSVRPQGPPPPALRPPDPFSSPARSPPPPAAQPSSDRHRYPPSYPSTESLASSAGPSSSAASFPSASSSSARQQAPQPSLQQLLQTVDLGAALKLVQTLQAQQTQQARVASTVGAGTAANSAVPAANATIEPVSPVSPVGGMGPRGASGLAPSGTFLDFADVPTPVSPLSPASFPGSASSAPNSDTPPSPAVSEGSAKPPPLTSRRMSLIGGLQRRLRTGSSTGIAELAGVDERDAATPAAAPAPPPRMTERQREKALAQQADEDETARSFEDQISRVYLSLSPATLRRAQNCARYLSLRYTPLLAALSAPERALPLPSPLDVARWRVERDEAEKRSARQQQASIGRSGAAGLRFRCARTGSRSGPSGGEGGGGGGRGTLGEDDWAGGAAGAGRLSTLGGVRTGAKPSPYGPRRNKAPKVWEIYPDDISDFVALGGRPTLAEAAQALEGGDVGAVVGHQQIGGINDAPVPVREHKRGSMSIDELFPSSSSSSGGARPSGSAAAAAPAAVDGDELADPSRIPTGASTSTTSSDGRAQPYLRNGVASSRSLATSDGRSSPLPRPASPASPPQRPFQPRQPSYEGAPFARSKHSYHSSDGVYPGSPLRRSTSLSTGPTGQVQPRSPVHTASPLLGRDPPGLGGEGSPYSRGGSALASRDDLSVSVGGGGGGTSSTSRHRGSHSTTEALRSGISRRLDRIRGRTMDEAGASTTALDAAHDSPAQPPSDSDYAVRSPPRRAQPPLPSPSSGGERRPFERPYLRKNNTSVDVTRPSGFESDGFVRSSGDEALMGGVPGPGGNAFRRAGNRILQSAWQGFKTSLDTYPDPWAYPPAMHSTRSLRSSGGRAGLAASRGAGESAADGTMRRSQIAEADEDFDSDVEWAAYRRRRQPREVVDLGEDDFGRLSSAIRQIRTESARIDEALPQQVAALSTCLDELWGHAESTTAETRITTHYSSPRLPASVLADIAHTKRRRTLDEDRSEGSGSESDTETATWRRTAPGTALAPLRLASRLSGPAALAATSSSRHTLDTSQTQSLCGSKRAPARRRSRSRPTRSRRTVPSPRAPKRSAARRVSSPCSTPSHSACSRTSCAT